MNGPDSKDDGDIFSEAFEDVTVSTKAQQESEAWGALH